MDSRLVLRRTTLAASLATAFALAGCPAPNATCPDGFVMGSDGRCVPMGDSGMPVTDTGGGDAGPGHTDANAGPDGCMLHAYYRDSDGDMYGDRTMSMSACTMPAGYVTDNTDCNDMDPHVHPGAVEACDGHDTDCDGMIDEGCTCHVGQMQACGSSVGACHMGMQTCVTGGTWASCMGGVMPTTEVCNAIDDDCDGQVDEGFMCVQNMPRAACTSVCGSSGSGTCTTACMPAAAANCAPPIEICNGVDEDCDGTADNGIETVGGPVIAVPATMTMQSPHLFAHGTGYGLVFASGGSLFLQLLNADGTVMPAGASPMNLNITNAWASNFSAVTVGTDVLVAYQAGGASGSYYVVRVNSSGGRVWNPFPLTLPSSEFPMFRAVIGAATATDAYVYVGYRTSAPAYGIHYFHVNVVGPTPYVADQGDLVTGLDSRVVFNVLATPTADHIVSTVSNGDLVLHTRSTGGASAMYWGPLAANAQARAIAMAIRDPSMNGGSGNLGVAWMAAAPGGVFVTEWGGTSVYLPSSQGAGTSLFFPEWLSMSAVPNTSSYMPRAHWLVGAIDSSGSSNVLQVWEVLGGSPTAPTASNPLSIAMESPGNQGDLSIAGVGSHFRIAEQASTGELVTRELGCHY